MKKVDILTGALRISDETGHGYVRDVESTIFPDPSKTPSPMVLEKTGDNWVENKSKFIGYSPVADFDGDMYSGEMPKRGVQTKRQRERSRQRYNNMSITRKKNVRDVRKDITKAVKKLKAKV